MEHPTLKEYEQEFAEFLYYTPTEMDKESPFWVVRAGNNVAKPWYRVGPRRIECYSIHFVREGSVVFEYEGKRIRLGKGDLFCMYPNKTYLYYKNSDEQALRLAWIAMDGPGIERMLTLAGLAPETPFLIDRWGPQLQDRLDAIMEALRREGPVTAAACLELKGLLHLFFSRFIRSDEEAKPDAGRAWGMKCAEYIRLHATEGISVQQAAEFAGLSRTYFTTLFTKSLGIPPSAYITKVRMSKAEEMLLGTSASVTEIAYSLGYPSLFSFTRAFSRYYAMSPSAYRKKNAK